MTTAAFYANLPILKQFADVAEHEHYHPLPDDWFVIVADVVDSTGAVERGQYKAVNMAGVSVITAVLNATRPAALPYVFGGDGASLCAPPEVMDQVRTALLGLRRSAKKAYGLESRVGVVPVADLQQTDCTVSVARLRVSAHYVQAVFTGGGLEQAESLIKSSEGSRYLLELPDPPDDAAIPPPDLAGLECRWQDIPAQAGEAVSLLVKATAANPSQQAAVYRDVVRLIHEIYGDDERCHPVRVEQLKLGGPNTHYEKALRSAGKSWLYRKCYGPRVKFLAALGQFLMDNNLHIGGIDWGKYRARLVANTDFRKFDDMLRCVLAGNADQRGQLLDALEQRHANGDLVFGHHVSDGVLITCMIDSYENDHFHFVDGANGGYTLAAKQLKGQIKVLAEEIA